MTDVSPASSTVTILIPVFNDWESLTLLIRDLDRALLDSGRTATVMVLDDASTADGPEPLPRPVAITQVEVVRLRRNLGHQRAIAVGLSLIAEERPCAAVVVMDADGEDAPTDVTRLLDRMDVENRRCIVFAERTRRAEGFKFKVFYLLYRLVHRILTGKGVRFGHFSAIPFARLFQLVVASELWNHYAAAVVKVRIPYVTEPTVRQKRLRGTSKMNFVALVMHGLSAVSVFSEIVGTRLLMGSLVWLLLCAGGLGAIAYVKLFTDLAIPGWASYTSAILLSLMVQVASGCLLFTFFVLNFRGSVAFLPARDYKPFIVRIDAVVPVPPGGE